MTPELRAALDRILDPARTMPPPPEESFIHREPSMTRKAVRTRQIKGGAPRRQVPVFDLAVLQAALDRAGGVVRHAAREIGCTEEVFHLRLSRGQIIRRGGYIKPMKYDLADLQAALDRAGGKIKTAARDVGCDVHTITRHVQSGKLRR